MSKYSISFAIAATLIAPLTLSAQAVTASILGTAHDDTGALVPKVRVTATNLDTNQTSTATTDHQGQYRLLSLPIGRYKVEATLAGFETFVENNLVLTVNEQHRVDLNMHVGSVQQQIEVQANAVQVETSNTQLGEVIETKQIAALPLNGRSYIDLLGLQAGVAPVSSGASTSNVVSGQLAAGNVSVNGQRESSNQFLVNGGDVSEGRNFGAAIVPNLDSVAEFRLITNSFDAEYGRFSGGVMNAITKSGNNRFHGTLFEFLRNNDLDSRGFFDPVRATLKRNQFGYAIGGPAIKNRLFWFTDYQGTRQIQGASTGLVQVPTVAQRNGQFSPGDLNGTVGGPYWAQVLSQRLGYTITDGEPYSTPSCTTNTQCVFPNGVIPTRAFSAAAAGTLKYIPLPNQGASGYATSSANTNIQDDKIGQRVDWITRSTGNWYAYYHYDNATLTNPLGASPFGFPTTTPSRAQQAVLSNVKTFGPSAVNEFRLSFVRDAITRNMPTDANVSLSSLGFVTGANTLGIVPSLGANQGVPVISTNEFTFGRSISSAGQYNNTYAVAESYSKVVGTHSLKFGGEYRYLQINERQPYAPNGDFSFDGSETGSDYADYLLGAPAQYIQASLQVLDSRTRYGALFAQDSWRARPNLTLNFGLRWEVSMPWYDTQNKIQTLVPGQQSTVFPTAPTGLVFPGDKGIPSTLAPTRWNNFGPRLGLAYSPSSSDGLFGKLLGG
ncbi:MAG: TonB-dependent receptor, partial [Acidobacteriaceae bacterium]|nr:TonB-dependent receptor [Acidobacteriaceae bacterium]